MIIKVRIFYGAKNASTTNPWGDGPEAFIDYPVCLYNDEPIKNAENHARRKFRQEMPEYRSMIRYVEIL